MTTRKLSRITSRNAGWQRRKDIEYFFLVIFTEATIGKKNNNQVDVDQHKINLNHFIIYMPFILFKTKPTDSIVVLCLLTLTSLAMDFVLIVLLYVRSLIQKDLTSFTNEVFHLLFLQLQLVQKNY